MTSLGSTSAAAASSVTNVPCNDAEPLDIPAALQTLRQAGAPRWEPLRWQYLATLAERLQAAPVSQQALLRAKWAQGFADCQARLSQRTAPAPQAAPTPSLSRGPRPPSALAQLTQALATAAASTQPGGPVANHPAKPELKSAQRFRESWAVLCAEDVVEQAHTQAPQNAGPLNAHMLVLRTLGLLRELSPDYLRRFLTHTETLMWLEAQQGRSGGGAKAKR